MTLNGEVDAKVSAAVRAPPRRELPAEGEDGLFSESWFPICRSEEVAPGAVVGRDFLDGKVIVFRGEDGVAQVMSAYCPHLGADLSCGDVAGNEVRCAFHHWRFERDGRCAGTGIGDAPPKGATLFRFPTVERWGLIFAFNGTEASWQLPDFPYPDDELLFAVEELPALSCDPWVVCCNTPDVQHLKVVHGVTIEGDDPDKDVLWTDHSMIYDFKGRQRGGEPFSLTLAIYGTSLFFQPGEVNGRWMGVAAPMALPRPGRTQVYMVVAVHKGRGTGQDLAAAEEQAAFGMGLEKLIFSEDGDILQNIHFRQGALGKSDRPLARFLSYLRQYPRSHQSSGFIR